MATNDNNENEQMRVENYTYLDEAVIVDVNGSAFAVGEDDMGYLTILRGQVYDPPEEEYKHFRAFESDEQSFTQIPTDDLVAAIDQLETDR